ncbi:MAG: hypothetical protein K0Q68_320 [Moraxellaceae bacterium]|jgi:hypothetical protein|nr:hypothetical protein [Moraxellaceae bacterium]
MTLSINALLRRRALFYAMDAQEHTAETIYWAVHAFLEHPVAERPAGSAPPLPVPPGSRTCGEREPVELDEPLLVRLPVVAEALGISAESVVDLAVERACPPLGMALDPQWFIAGLGP